MKVNGSSNVFYMGEEHEQKVNPKLDRDDAVVFAGNLKFTSDTIEAKRKDAQEKALRVVGEAYDNDRKIDDELEGRRERIREIRDELSAINKEYQRIDGLKEELRKSMGIEADSEEQKDLELLEKPYFELTKEERERVDELHKNGLTEYQTAALEYNKAKAHWGQQAADLKKEMLEENVTIKLTRQELLKNTGMLEADKQADDIMDAASDEIRSMLLEDVKKHIDEEAKEREEEAEKLAEAKKDKSKSKEDKLKISEEELLKKAMKTDKVKEEVSVKQKVQSILDEAKLSVNDILGAKVDTNA